MSTLVATPSSYGRFGAPRQKTVFLDSPDERFPLSRFTVRPLAVWLACRLSSTRLRPVHVTIAGGIAALLATAVLSCSLGPPGVAALLVLAAWLCDRLDGELARRQGTASAWGAWLDANLDELADVGLHAGVTAAAAVQLGAAWPWGLFTAFVSGKYLFMYGLSSESTTAAEMPAAARRFNQRHAFLRSLYHLPANADVRVHALVLALAWNALVVELAWVAAYYNLRWIARYVLVARRLQGGRE